MVLLVDFTWQWVLHIGFVLIVSLRAHMAIKIARKTIAFHLRR